jgi:ABC-type glycerol-3-phosphate transport system substrate-binding protein
MKIEHYNRMVMNRRTWLKGSAAVSAASMTGALGAMTKNVSAQDNWRAQILQIPGVNKGSPTDADWQKVGELCLGATKENVKEGEFKGVELSFMGLNNQNLHNLLFRGFLKPWEAYTGASIKWIDLAQADYNPRLQQAIATGTVDFDIVEMGAPFEGDVCGKGLASEMPDWVKKQIDMDDYVGYLTPVGTWGGKTIASPSTATVTPSTIAPTTSPMLIWPRLGRTKATKAIGPFPRPGRRFRRSPSFSKAKSSVARMPMDTSILLSHGAGLPSTSSAAVPRPMPSIQTTRPGCSMPTR